MIKTYMAFVAALYALNLLAKRRDWPVADEVAAGWVRRVRRQHWAVREVVDGLAISAGAWGAALYTHYRVLPAIDAAGLVLLAEALLRLLGGIAIGVPVGYALVRAYYQFWRATHE